MSNNDHIQNEVQRTMHALDGLESARINDSFYERLQNEMQDRKIEKAHFQTWFSLAAAAVIILLLVNIFTLRGYQQNYADEESERQKNLEALAEEYQQELPYIYDINGQE